MPTNHKTPNLNLNSWIATDKPMREDFVSDNTIIDTILGQHLSNTNIHLSATDRQTLNAPFVVGSTTATGESTSTVTLPFAPSMIIVFKRQEPPIQYDATNHYTIVNAALATSSYSNTAGVTLSGSTLTLHQTQNTPSDGVFLNMGALNGQYTYIAFR